MTVKKCQPFDVATAPILGTLYTRYQISFDGVLLREQISYPDQEQCLQAAWHALHEARTIKRKFYNRILEAVIEANDARVAA